MRPACPSLRDGVHSRTAEERIVPAEAPSGSDGPSRRITECERAASLTETSRCAVSSRLCSPSTPRLCFGKTMRMIRAAVGRKRKVRDSLRLSPEILIPPGEFPRRIFLTPSEAAVRSCGNSADHGRRGRSRRQPSSGGRHRGFGYSRIVADRLADLGQQRAVGHESLRSARRQIPLGRVPAPLFGSSRDNPRSAP